jgi:hypothetical protein
MAPATLAGATARATKARTPWDRDSIINAIREWVATYGEPPRAADWNPSSAKWSGQLWRVERYRAGRAGGTPWPALNSAKRPFNGSLTEAIVAAGFEPAKPGPRRRRDVNPEQADRAVISPEGRAMLEAALARAREAERRVAALEARLDRARVARTPKRAAHRVAVAAAPRAPSAAVTRAMRAAAKAADELATARMDAAEARTTAKKLASRLERSEATVSSLRDERRQLKADRDRARDRVVALERLLEAARQVAPVVIHEAGPDVAVLREAQAAARAARRDAEAAELRAARSERELRETVAAVKGEQRRLTRAELDELRAAGPTGPGVMAAAIKTLAAARADGDRTALKAALTEVARSAITWQERI